VCVYRFYIAEPNGIFYQLLGPIPFTNFHVEKGHSTWQSAEVYTAEILALLPCDLYEYVT